MGGILADAQGGGEPVAVAQRLPGTIATNVMAYERGASVLPRARRRAGARRARGGGCYVGRAMDGDADDEI